MFNILLNGSDPNWLHGMSVAFEERPHFKVIENHDPLLLLEQTRQVLPEVLVWRTTQQDEAEILEVINECPQVMIVLVVDDPNRFDILKLMNMGVKGCLPLRLLPRQIVQAVELMVIAGIVCFPRLNMKKPAGHNHLAIPPSLTLREREILTLLCNNHSNQEIAATICVAESTVKTHLHNIFRKMGINKRSEAIAAVYQNRSAFPSC